MKVSSSKRFLGRVLRSIVKNQAKEPATGDFWEGDFYLVGGSFGQDNFIKLPPDAVPFMLQDLADALAVFDETAFIVKGEISKEYLLSDRRCLVEDRALAALRRASRELPVGRVYFVVRQKDDSVLVCGRPLREFRKEMEKVLLSYGLVTPKAARDMTDPFWQER